mmetsp:Transcript_23823/g.28111  ORF Transcript_23823/g.28111 Transcript_23823/m.28111 type:complete len:503 (+) Transcript_23823:41-1549(+)
MEEFKSDGRSYVPGHHSVDRNFAIRNPRNYCTPSPDIFGLAVNSNVSRPTEFACNSSTSYSPSTYANYSMVHPNINAEQKEQHEQQTPYISTEGRRKRRRIEDAFENLSLRPKTASSSTTPDVHFTSGEMHPNANRVTEQKAQSNNPTSSRNEEMYFPGASGRTTAVTPLTVSKKLFSDTSTEGSFNLQMGGNEDVGNYSLQKSNYSLHSNLSSIPDDFQVRRSNIDRGMKDDYSLSTTKYSQLEDDDGQNSCSSATSSRCSTPDKKSTLHHNYHHPLHDTLLAPRKSKYRGGSRIGAAVPAPTTDPVDARIEELIRHTRIRAMVEASIMVEKENEHKSNTNTRDNDEFLIRVKNQQEDEKEMDCGQIHGMADGELRRKNSGGYLDRRQVEDQQQNGMVTRDDFDLKVKSLKCHSLRSSRAWGQNQQSGRVIDSKPTNMDIQHSPGGHERGRSCQMPYNHGDPQPGRSKSLPKHAKYYNFPPSCNNRNDTAAPAEDRTMLNS